VVDSEAGVEFQEVGLVDLAEVVLAAEVVEDPGNSNSIKFSEEFLVIHEIMLCSA
jgi:hypothetical protein